MNHEQLIQLGLSDEQINQVCQMHQDTLQNFVPKTEFDSQLQNYNRLMLVHALDNALSSAGAKNPAAIRGLLNFDCISLAEDGSISGLNEQLDSIKSSDSYLFNDSPSGLNLGSTGSFARNSYTNHLNPWAKDTFNLTMQAKLLKENPDLAQKLKSLAGA